MSDGLRSGEKITRGIRQILKKHASGIKKQLKCKRISNEPGSVHIARKHIKKLRALLRLVRERLGNKTYHRQNAVLRKLGRALSGMRDSTVQLQTLA